MCSESGQIGAVLRREGLYSSNVSEWRKLRAGGELQALSPQKTGRPRKQCNPLEPEVAKLRHHNAKLQEELRKARIIIEVQKKVAEMLGDPIPDTSEWDG